MWLTFFRSAFVQIVRSRPGSPILPKPLPQRSMSKEFDELALDPSGNTPEIAANGSSNAPSSIVEKLEAKVNGN